MQIGILNPYQNYTSNARNTFGSKKTGSVMTAKQKEIDNMATVSAKWWTDLLKQRQESLNENIRQEIGDDQYLIFNETLKGHIKKAIKNYPTTVITISVDKEPESPELIEALRKAKIGCNAFTLPSSSYMQIHNGKIIAKAGCVADTEVIYQSPNPSVLLNIV